MGRRTPCLVRTGYLGRSGDPAFTACAAVNWIYDTLKHDDNGRVARDYFLDKLRLDFGDMADEQLDTAINWGRYAELFAYDENAGKLCLEN